MRYWEKDFGVCIYAKKLLDKVIYLNSVVKALSPVDVLEVKKAIYYARKYHGSQMRQSGEPYYSHPIEVACMVAEYTASKIPSYFRTDIIVTSILHDTLEDTKLTEKMIAYIFGDKVASQVEALTRVKPHGKISSAETLDFLFQQKKYDVALIKIVDRIHNLETVSIKSPEKINKIIEETLKSFLSMCIYLEHSQLDDYLYELCCNATHKKPI
ncbi:HD domain-containing protein [Rickettsia endosymbiont of Urophora cardui]|uniref:HD domain-containing protein n=1 Tax=Rickettsia endosymbiont of Urophora cardui TaxID=3066265 RepID=UPI00313F1059